MTTLLVAEHWPDDLQRFLQLLESVGECAELAAERVVLEFEPASSDSQRCTPTGYVIESGDRLRKQRGVTVGVPVTRAERRTVSVCWANAHSMLVAPGCVHRGRA